jgi:trehalose-phosphatase
MLFKTMPRLLMFDFDGTLSPLAATPKQACLSSSMKLCLAHIASQPQTQVAVVSGRGLADLEMKIGLANLVYVGNHGLSTSWGKLSIPAGELRHWRELTKDAIFLLEPVVRNYPGCVLEDKEFDLSVHYRLVKKIYQHDLLMETKQALAQLPLIAREGKKAIEFRPVGGRDKGGAVKLLSEKLALGWESSGFCLYIGDDATDEDAFKVVNNLGSRAVSIKVGPGKTQAAYRLNTVDEVDVFLRKLNQVFEP